MSIIYYVYRAWIQGTPVYKNAISLVDFSHNVHTLDIFFSSNHNIHKSSCGLCFWASDPLIERFQ